MSYILEALKKSQQERELGRVPTLDTSGMFAEDKEPVRPSHWGLLAVGLAAVAVAIALYAVLRAPEPAPVPMQAGAVLGESPVPPPMAVPLASGSDPEQRVADATSAIDAADSQPALIRSVPAQPASPPSERVRSESLQPVLPRLRSAPTGSSAAAPMLEEDPGIIEDEEMAFEPDSESELESDWSQSWIPGSSRSCSDRSMPSRRCIRSGLRPRPCAGANARRFLPTSSKTSRASNSSCGVSKAFRRPSPGTSRSI